jgi:hypothetical protein
VTGSVPLRSTLIGAARNFGPKAKSVLPGAETHAHSQKIPDVSAAVKSRFLPNRAGDCRFFDLNTRLLVGNNN